MANKKIEMMGIFIVAILFSMILVFGYGQIVDRANRTNSTSIVENFDSVINLSLSNSTKASGIHNISEINISLFGNFDFSTGSNRTGNFSAGANNIKFSSDSTSSNLTIRNATGIQNNRTNDSAFSFNLTDISGPGVYNITITLINTSGSAGVHLKHNITITVNDTTAPNVSSAAGFVSNTNHTGILNFNFTLRDNQGDNDSGLGGMDGTGISTVNFTIFNASVRTDFNETLSEGTTSLVGQNISGTGSGYFNLSIDTSKYKDGIYNITIYVNDTSGNVNSTNITNVRFDNNGPTATFTCSPNPAHNGDTVTCTCTPSDPVTPGNSGINPSQTSFVSSPSTASNGNTTLTCSFEDHAGNAGSVTTELEVIVPSGGGSSGGGGGGSGVFSYTSTISLENENFEDLGTINQLLSARQRVSLKIAGETHYVGIRELMTTSAKVEIFSEPVIVSLDIGEEVKVDVNDDNVYDVYVILNGIINGKADLTITYIQDEIPQVEIGEGVETTGEIVEEEKEEPSSKGLNVMLIGLIVLIVIALVFWILKKRKVI